MDAVASIDLGQPLGQLRAAPVRLAPDEPDAVLLLYGADQDIDPFMGMFFFPTDTLKVALWRLGDGLMWQREMHRGVIPGVWFSPALPFDLDGDGTDEIWMVVNGDVDHPLNIKGFGLERIDPITGRTTERLKWHGLDFAPFTASERYRHFLCGGHAGGRPILACVQGTYARIQMQGLDASGTYAWSRVVERGSSGARASHCCPVVDFDQDGDDEFFIGERCVRFRDGTDLLVADEHVWNGHSDVIAPFWSRNEHCWNLFTARETPYASPAPPRVVAFGPDGRRLWCDLEQGHMDMGWVGRLQDDQRHVAYALKLGGKRAGPQGFERSNCEEFFWDARTGHATAIGVSAFERLPVDVDGDGRHELAPGPGRQTSRDIHDRKGKQLGRLPEGTRIAHASRLIDRPGEQLLGYCPDGKVMLFACEPGTASDSPDAAERYAHPYYRRNRALTAVGYNFANLGGI